MQVTVQRTGRPGLSSHGAEAAMLIIVGADVNALVGKEKKMRVKVFFGAD